MKKIILSAIIIASFTLATKAQTGSILVYGNVGISSISNGSNPKITQATFNPAVGYQFNNNWTTGLSFAYTDYNSNYNSQSFSVSPFIRYAATISPIFSVYGQFQAGYLHSSVSDNIGGGKSNGFDAQLFPAVFINVKNGFGLNFSFGGLEYNSQKPSGGGSATNNFSLTFGSGASFGISKNFGGKKSHS